MDEAKKLTHRLLYAANCFPNVTCDFVPRAFLRVFFLFTDRDGADCRHFSLLSRQAMISAAPARLSAEITPIIARRRVGATHPPLVR
jgi:hypothetical protein